ncbi:hypothetical protein [Methylobacterium sp. E-046]|uniref:hypothetical protein n=1 Tax=Methylobacterium sp. E-046 TaxID=2836576 RepID=UPI001FBA047B|nr:hypothetical protein [Methylobacterium sp. E-046]MCJ2103230.1 hypothetical protein [Methylobacterium sp. E-046]
MSQTISGAIEALPVRLTSGRRLFARMGTIAILSGVLLGMVARIGMLLGGLFWLFGLISLQDVILRHYWRSAAQTPEREVTRDVGSSHCSYPIHVKTLHISGGRPRERQFVSPLQGLSGRL